MCVSKALEPEILETFIDPFHETIVCSILVNKKKLVLVSIYNLHFAFSKDYLKYLEKYIES